MTDEAMTAVERVAAAFIRTDDEGFTPEIEQVFIDDLPIILTLARQSVGVEEIAAMLIEGAAYAEAEGSIGADAYSRRVDMLLSRLTSVRTSDLTEEEVKP